MFRRLLHEFLRRDRSFFVKGTARVLEDSLEGFGKENLNSAVSLERFARRGALLLFESLSFKLLMSRSEDFAKKHSEFIGFAVEFQVIHLALRERRARQVASLAARSTCRGPSALAGSRGTLCEFQPSACFPQCHVYSSQASVGTVNLRHLLRLTGWIRVPRMTQEGRVKAATPGCRMLVGGEAPLEGVSLNVSEHQQGKKLASGCWSCLGQLEASRKRSGSWMPVDWTPGCLTVKSCEWSSSEATASAGW